MQHEAVQKLNSASEIKKTAEGIGNLDMSNLNPTLTYAKINLKILNRKGNTLFSNLSIKFYYFSVHYTANHAQLIPCSF